MVAPVVGTRPPWIKHWMPPSASPARLQFSTTPMTSGRQRMVRANLKGINTVKKRHKDGTVKVHHYHRATGRPLRGAPGSAEFLNDYALAEQSQAEKRQGTLGGLV